MKLLHFLSVAALFFTMQVCAQTTRQVTGLVKDSTGATLPWATVKLLTDKDSSVVATNSSGRFSFPSVSVNQFSLVVSSLGYEGVKRRYNLAPGSTTAELDPIILKNDPITLQGVTVTNVNAIKIKEDTIEYNAAAYKVREGAVIEDAIKKMPGLEISNDGNITAQGKQVNKVRLNGKDYMAGDVKSLTRNLPANLVQNVQVINDYGDQANITGIKIGDPQKVLNINIKKDKNHGYFGQGTVGIGRDAIQERDGTKNGRRYVASTNVFNFQGKRQITLSGDFNNTNTSLFTFTGGDRPNVFGPDPKDITTARSLGFNYRDDWSKKVKVYGSYSLADNSVYTTSKTVQNNISGQLSSIQNSSSTENAQNLNHRFKFNIEYKPDTMNYFKFIPTFSYSGVDIDQTFVSKLQAQNVDNTLISDYTRRLLSHAEAPNFGISALYNHRFQKHGRNFSVLVTSGTTTNKQYQNPVYNYLAGNANAPVNQMINTNRRTDSAGLSLSYLEPIGKKSYLEFSYQYHNSQTVADRLTDTVTNAGDINRDPDLSNDYSFNFITNNFRVNYQIIDQKYNFTLGLAAQPTLLKGSSSVTVRTHKTIYNFSPVLHYVYNFSELQALAFDYQGASNSPAYHQLQPVIDFSESSYPMQGNPDLLPEYNNSFQVRYNKFGDGTGKTFFVNLSFTQTDHKIVANTVTYPHNYTADPRLAGAILTKYQNASGFYNATAYYAFAKPWAKRKYSLFFNGKVTYNNNISYLTNVLDPLGINQTIQKNMAKNLVLSQGVRFRVDIPDVLDAEANANYSINRSQNSVPDAYSDNNFQTITLGTNGNLYFFKSWTLNYNYSKAIYEGYNGATNPNVLNTYIERRFLKNNVGTLRFSVYDAFNENTGFTSTQNAYAITQSNVNRLGRYYLFTFTLRLQKFAGRPPRGMPGGPGGGG
nr:TonB-dependent receptor [uncultured Pedobacter sp.]